MKINNINECLQFFRSNGLTNLNSDSQAFTLCMEEYGRLCSCDPESVRSAKLNKCKTIYLNFIGNISQFKNIILSKVANDSVIFCNDGQIIITITH